MALPQQANTAVPTQGTVLYGRIHVPESPFRGFPPVQTQTTPETALSFSSTLLQLPHDTGNEASSSNEEIPQTQARFAEIPKVFEGRCTKTVSYNVTLSFLMNQLSAGQYPCNVRMGGSLRYGKRPDINKIRQFSALQIFHKSFRIRNRSHFL